ncbi:uncharacterized protein LOC105190417 [Harpegnathos saltator]|uniref:uncharacterized protein LOC105190417 n=1 Tax=Harpegnathos saltator TaxID=610380 RepID=UPI00058D3A1D|nr:uncharacterized protein LOC105190417 [Harpegnathos saltator]
MAERKTEAIFLYKKGWKPPQAQIRVGTVRLPIEAQMKYLGLTLDGTWCFKEHMSRLVPRLRVVSANVGRLMPNIGGPGWKARRLHAGILNSVALYGAPVWAESLDASRPMQAQLRKAHRAVAVRVARCYRTLSHVAATTLAGMPPLELLALIYRTMYIRKRELLQQGEANEALAGAIRRMKHQARLVLLQRWQRILANARYGRRTVESVQRCLQQWVGRAFGTLTFRMTQVLTGHGCFGEYLCRIGKGHTATCHHCGHDHDSAQHTLQDCPAWSAERRVMIREIGRDLLLPTIVGAIVGNERKWEVFASFCEAVISQKEVAEEDRREAEGRCRRRRRRERHRLWRGDRSRSSEGDVNSSEEDEMRMVGSPSPPPQPAPSPAIVTTEKGSEEGGAAGGDSRCLNQPSQRRMAG